jgi:hypothetical protein
LEIRRCFFPKALPWHFKGPTGVKRTEQNRTEQDSQKPRRGKAHTEEAGTDPRKLTKGILKDTM